MSDRRIVRVIDCEDGGQIFFLGDDTREYHPPVGLQALWKRIKRLFRK
jgi:hypothetical protein